MTEQLVPQFRFSHGRSSWTRSMPVTRPARTLTSQSPELVS